MSTYCINCYVNFPSAGFLYKEPYRKYAIFFHLILNFPIFYSEIDSTESPASPPHEPSVFVAAAPKIISDYDMRSAADASFQTPTRQYRVIPVFNVLRLCLLYYI